MDFKNEFQRSRFSIGNHRPFTDFVICQWGRKGSVTQMWIYPLYRWISAFILLGFCSETYLSNVLEIAKEHRRNNYILSFSPSPPPPPKHQHAFFLMYLTVWNFTILTTYFLLAAINWTMAFMGWNDEQHDLLKPEVFPEPKRKDSNPGPGEDEQFLISKYGNEPGKFAKFLLKSQFLLWSICGPCSLMVTFLYFLVVYTSKDKITLHAAGVHILNSIFVVADVMLSNQPVRILHFLYPMFLGTVYFLVNVLYWTADHRHVVYKIIDWNKPGVATAVALSALLIGIPLQTLTLFTFYRLRTFLASKLGHSKDIF